MRHEPFYHAQCGCIPSWCGYGILIHLSTSSSIRVKIPVVPILASVTVIFLQSRWSWSVSRLLNSGSTTTCGSTKLLTVPESWCQDFDWHSLPTGSTGYSNSLLIESNPMIPAHSDSWSPIHGHDCKSNAVWLMQKASFGPKSGASCLHHVYSLQVRNLYRCLVLFKSTYLSRALLCHICQKLSSLPLGDCNQKSTSNQCSADTRHRIVYVDAQV